MRKLLPLFFFLAAHLTVSAQVQTGLTELIREDTATVYALALYPDSVRNAALDVCRYPEILVKTDAIQKKSAAAFREMMNPLSREQQGKIWDILRYPGLAQQLTEGGQKTNEQVTAIAGKYPEEIRPAVLAYGRSEYDLLRRLNELGRSSDKALDEVLKPYDKRTTEAAHELMKYPELVSMLTGNMKLSVMIGDAAKSNPDRIRLQLDSLGLAQARERAQQVEDWKTSLESDPQAKKEFEEAAKEYAGEQGKTGETLVIYETQIVTQYVCYPYPYWYGSPWWWDYPYWYPYPYWYDWGYYYGPYGIVFIGYPSFHFTHWYFHHHHHHYHYPHFSEHCMHYYEGHRRVASGMNGGIEHWRNESENNLPSGFLKPDAARVTRWQELGKMELERDAYNKANPAQPMTQEKYYQEHAKEYPSLGKVPPRSETPRPVVKPQQQQVYPQVFPKTPPPAPRPQQPKTTPKVSPKPQQPKTPAPAQPRPAPKPKQTRPK